MRLILKSGLFLCSKNIDFAKKVRVIFKSGFYSRAGYNRDFTVVRNIYFYAQKFTYDHTKSGEKSLLRYDNIKH